MKLDINWGTLEAKFDVEDGTLILKSLSESERLEVMNNFCKHCANKDLPCYCSNDE